MGRIFKRIVLALFAVAIFDAAPLQAQEYSPPGAPPIRATIDPNGVDLSRGTMISHPHTVSIGGSGNMGIAFTRFVYSNGGTLDSIAGFVSISGSVYTAVFGTQTQTFNKVGSNYESVEKTGSTLSQTSDGYILTTGNGIVVTYKYEAGTNMYGGAYAIAGVALPTGELLTYNYKKISICYELGSNPCASHVTIARVQSITSTNGYMLKLSFSNYIPENQYETVTWFNINKVTALNASVDYCDPFADTCSYSKTWPSLTMGAVYYSGSSVLTFTDTMNYVTTYNFTSNRLTGVQRPGASSNNVTIGYSGVGLVNAVNNDGVLTNYAYVDDIPNSLRTTTISDPSTGDRIVKIDTDAMQVLSDKNELGKETKFDYDPTTRLLTKVTAPELNMAEFLYDVRGNRTKTTVTPKPGSPLSPIVTEATFPPSDAADASKCTSTYAAVRCNKALTTKDAKGNITQYAYDNGHGGITRVTLPPASGTVLCPSTGIICPETRYSYTTTYTAKYKDSSGTLVNFTTPVTRLTKTSACQTTASCADAADETKSVIGYGTNNVLPTSVASGSGNGALTATSSFSYDDIGNRVTVDGPLSGTADTSRSYYDDDRRVTGVVGPDPDGAGTLKYQAQRFTYNADSQVTVAEIGTANNQTDATMATFATLQQVTSTYDSATARKTKDVLSAPTTATSIQVTQYSYDSLGRPECQALRMNSATWSSLPASACTLATTGSAGPDRITRTTYDAVSRVSMLQSAYGITTTNGFPATLQRNEATYSYTDNGQTATLADAKNNLTTYEYDGFDRVTKMRYPSPTSPGTSSTTDYQQPGYDANSNVTSLRLRDNQSIAFTFDNLNRIAVKNLPGTEPDVAYTYDLLNRSLTLVGATTLTNSYDALSRQTFAGEPFGSMTYEYDLAGRRTKATWADGFYVGYDYQVTGEVTVIRENGATTGPGVLATYAYDQLGNRTSLTRGNGTVTSYTPDTVSRLSSLTQNLTATVSDQTLGFTYNLASQITTRTATNDAYAMKQQYNADRDYTTNGLNQYLTAGVVFPSYDGRGNLTAQGASTYSYSSENLLKAASGGVTLYYDPLGRLNEYDASASTRFAYDGNEIATEVANPSGAIQRRYVHGPGADEPIVWYEGSGTTDRRWLHADERGSIIAVSDGSGNAIGINSYDEWGNPKSTNIGRFGYTGQTWLGEIGLWYYKARMYSARLGRFIQTDPIGFGGGMNLYAYVRNDPINGTDPSGTDACFWANGQAMCSGGWTCYGCSQGMNISDHTAPGSSSSNTGSGSSGTAGLSASAAGSSDNKLSPTAIDPLAEILVIARYREEPTLRAAPEWTLLEQPFSLSVGFLAGAPTFGLKNTKTVRVVYRFSSSPAYFNDHAEGHEKHSDYMTSVLQSFSYYFRSSQMFGYISSGTIAGLNGTTNYRDISVPSGANYIQFAPEELTSGADIFLFGRW